MEGSARPPGYQRFFKLIGYILVGIAGLGGVLSAMRNASALISILTASVLTAMVAASAVTMHLYLRKHPLPWVIDGRLLTIKRFGPRPILVTSGAVLLLWVGAAIHKAAESSAQENDAALELLFGSHELSFGTTNNIIYGVPHELNEATFNTSYLPVYVSNTDPRKRVLNVTVRLMYSGPSRVSLTRSMRQDTLGVKEAQQIRRRTQTFEDTDFTFISIDEIGPGQTYLLNEPIELTKDLLSSLDNAATIAVDVAGRDHIERGLHLDLRCIVASSIPETEQAVRTFTWRRVVASRRSMGFITYLGHVLRRERGFVTIVVPEFRAARNNAGASGYISDAMHDKVKTISYTMAPRQYLLAPFFE